MIECIEGTLIDITTQKAILLVHGIGYGAHITLTTFDRLCGKLGTEVRLYTTHIVREDSTRLFGFLETSEKKLFELLHTAIGPKTAIALLGHLSKETLKEAIEFGQTETLTRVPGIGKKSAERIIVELKGKFQDLPLEKSHLEDAVQALVHLGYTAQEARKKLTKAQDKVAGSADLQSLLKAALQTT
ncbi:MAG: Holliday junction branch migration protein RuvA [Chlamydiia bacterium]